MSLITGSAMGTTTQQEDIYLEGSPTIYIQRYEAPEMYAPDSDGFYWQLTGTATYNVYEIGCVTDNSLTESLVSNDILCDNVGVKGTIQQRNYIEFTFTLQSFFPFTVLTNLIKGGTVTENGTEHTEKFGLGPVNNNIYWHCWAPKVYDESVGDYIGLQLHKCQFVNPFNIAMPFGSPWSTPITLRAFADTSLPSAQQFVTLVRADISVL